MTRTTAFQSGGSADVERRYHALRSAALIARARYLDLRNQRHAAAGEVLRARALWVTLEGQCTTLARELGIEQERMAS